MANADPIRARIAAWNKSHPASQRIDPQAALAVSSQEGLSGGIGDGGHAFGPFQLNNAGGVITGKFAGQTPAQINQWAWSPGGIDYALGGIAKASGGQSGGSAVNSIVRGFERPQDPNGEASRALASLGLPVSGGSGISGGGGALAPASAPAGFTQGQQYALSLLSSQNPSLAQLLSSVARPQAQAAPPQPPQSVPVAPSASRRLAQVPGQFDTRPGIQVDQSILPAVEQLATRFGVKVNSGYRSPQHNQAVGGAPESDHLTGDAVDFTGSPQAMQALYGFAQKSKFPYVEPWGQTGGSHVHISLRR